MTKSLKFTRKYKCFELRACAENLTLESDGAANTTIELVKWERDIDNNEWCFTLAYFVRGKEGYSLRFVGARPFLYLSDAEASELWKELRIAQSVLDTFFDLTDE